MVSSVTEPPEQVLVKAYQREQRYVRDVAETKLVDIVNHLPGGGAGETKPFYEGISVR